MMQLVLFQINKLSNDLFSNNLRNPENNIPTGRKCSEIYSGYESQTVKLLVY